MCPSVDSRHARMFRHQIQNIVPVDPPVITNPRPHNPAMAASYMLATPPVPFPSAPRRLVPRAAVLVSTLRCPQPLLQLGSDLQPERIRDHGFCAFESPLVLVDRKCGCRVVVVRERSNAPLFVVREKFYRLGSNGFEKFLSRVLGCCVRISLMLATCCSCSLRSAIE